MLSMLREWNGTCEVDGQKYNSIEEFILAGIPLSGKINIKLYSRSEKPLPGQNKADREEVKSASKEVETLDQEYRITVKKYMTEKSSPGFDFMAKWNNDKPMPLRTMTGTILQETRGMLKMKLRGFGEATCTCMRCGRPLSNPVSRFYGIGPECMAKLGLIRDVEDVDGIKEDLINIEWEGWVIKSAITDKEVV